MFACEPVLKHPDPTPFVIQDDASDVAVGAVLLQKNSQGRIQPCASRNLTVTERGWAIWEKEVGFTNLPTPALGGRYTV